MDIASKTKLNNGVEIPWIALGTWSLSPGREAETAVQQALAAGYRHIDTASLYRNERSVGEGVRKSDVPRSEVFVTTKLWSTDHGYDKALAAAEESLRLLAFDYVDLYLIHWPQPRQRQETWQALERLLNEGKARAIGVSNYQVHHLEDILALDSVVPAVNQIDLSPYNYQRQKGVVDFCREHGILLEAYSPLTKGRRLSDPRLQKIADKYGKSTAQILIRWNLQHAFVPLPKSSKPEHIRSNIDVFDFTISEEDMATLDSFGGG